MKKYWRNLPAASVICGVPRICPACCVLAKASCWPWLVVAVIAKGVLLVMICVCGWPMLAILTIGVACTCTGAIDTAFKTWYDQIKKQNESYGKCLFVIDCLAYIYFTGGADCCDAVVNVTGLTMVFAQLHCVCLLSCSFCCNKYVLVARNSCPRNKYNH